MVGKTTDTWDGNVTECVTTMCRPPAEMVPPEAQRDPRTMLLGETQYAAGTKHNDPMRKTLLGRAFMYQGPVWTKLRVEWREHTGSFGHWVYKGHLASDGRTVTGSFHMSCLPRKKGTFSLQAVDPATTTEDSRAWWASVTRASLTRRVIVKWAVGSIEKRARQQELIAEAAAQVVAAPGAQ